MWTYVRIKYMINFTCMKTIYTRQALNIFDKAKNPGDTMMILVGWVADITSSGQSRQKYWYRSIKQIRVGTWVAHQPFCQKKKFSFRDKLICLKEEIKEVVNIRILLGKVITRLTRFIISQCTRQKGWNDHLYGFTTIQFLE